MPSVPSYGDYLKLDRLLSLQGGLEEDESKLSSDELHFIIVHQAYELWFKLVLRELRLARDELARRVVAEETVPRVVHHLRRVNAILDLGAQQFRVMETLAPQDFLDFRDKLVPASGFQSVQMREIEIVLGLEDVVRAPIGGAEPLEHVRQAAAESTAGAMAWQRLAAAQRETTLRGALSEWLQRTPIQGSRPSDPDDARTVEDFLGEYLQAYEVLQRTQLERMSALGAAGSAGLAARCEAATQSARTFLFAEDVAPADRALVRRTRAGIVFIESYRDLPLLAWPRLLVDTVVELEEMLVLWRTRHARMVERTIGRRIGTGGSAGVEYLDKTATYRIFTELWSVRTLLLPRRALPKLRAPEFYGFAL